MDQNQISAANTVRITELIMRTVNEPNEQIFLAVSAMLAVADKVGLTKKDMLELLPESVINWPGVEVCEIAAKSDLFNNMPTTLN